MNNCPKCSKYDYNQGDGCTCEVDELGALTEGKK